MSEVTQNENKRSRKDIIKDIAIAFLAILLLLTFFSNTIMNYSLPEVAIQQVVSGSISPIIRGTGTVEASDPYNVKVSQERVIKSVAVAEGDHVNKGDVLYNLEDKESTELTEAEDKLDELVQSYETSLFSGDLDNDAINRVRNGKTMSIDEYQAKLKAASDRYDAAKNADDLAQAAIDELSQQQAYTSAQYSYDEATPNYVEADITAEIARLENEASVTGYDYSARIAQLQDIQANITRDTSQITTQAGQVDSDYNRKMASLQDTKNKTAAELELATNERTELLTSIAKEIELSSSLETINEQKETVEKLKKESTGGTITAPVAGTVTSLSLKAGETTSADNEVAVIQIDGKGMVTSFSVTIDQAKNLKVGDKAEPQNAWYYTDFKATLKSISADTANPNTKKLLTFSIESTEVQNGQSVSLQIGEKSDDYDLTVPAGCVREDTNGKFILIVNSKSSPLGNRYIATRVDVEVLASDDTTAAISGSLEGDEYVITTATSPVKAGDQVRLANEND